MRSVHLHPAAWPALSALFTQAPMPHMRLLQFDGGKLICLENMLLDEPGCQIFSMGSKGNYNFERAMLEVRAAPLGHEQLGGRACSLGAGMGSPTCCNRADGRTAENQVRHSHVRLHI